MSWGGRRSKFDTFEEREDVVIMDGIEDYQEMVDAEFVERWNKLHGVMADAIIKLVTK